MALLASISISIGFTNMEHAAGPNSLGFCKYNVSYLIILIQLAKKTDRMYDVHLICNYQLNSIIWPDESSS